MRARFRRAVGWTVLLCGLTACGRVGVNLLPLAHTRADAGPGAADGGEEAASMPDAGEAPGGGAGVCVDGVCANDVDRCPNDGNKSAPGVCGCGVPDSDADSDRVPDCNDLCPDGPDRLVGGLCGCAAAAADSDGDGFANCQDACPSDPIKSRPAVCGCGIADADRDGDGMPDCADACPDDMHKVVAGACGCGRADMDANHDGTLDCLAACSGAGDAAYVPTTSCGVGYCATTSTPSTCSAGVEVACKPGKPRSESDANCGGVDDDCDGSSDEDYVPAAISCGQGACMRSGMRLCMNRALLDSCTAGTPTSMVDGPTANGVDDDCDGSVDEDACDPTPHTFTPGVHEDIEVPALCNSVTIRLWGGGGASGQTAYGASGGRGGAGGYAEQSFAISGTLRLYIGEGAAASCNAGGANPGAASYSGGTGGTGNGQSGADGMVAGGGAGARPGNNRNGGHGFYGGGGGGASDDPTPVHGPPGVAAGGGGGAASAFFMNGVLEMVAGGGGGGGGAASVFWSSGQVGGAGGDGCGGDGAQGASNRCGGGGGGGVCMATTVQAGSAGIPFDSGMIPAGQAQGGSGNCDAGGGGYAIVVFGS